VADLGLDLGFVADLMLKTLYFAGNVSGGELCDRMALPVNVAGEILSFLRRERLCETTGGTGMSPATLYYTLTEAGLERAAKALAMSGYVGPAPVPLETYFDYVRSQSIMNVKIPRDHIEAALSALVLDQRTVDLVGQAISSKRAFLIFGASGNGKSAAADCLANVLPGNILIPRAVQVMHQVIQVFDPSSHHLVGESGVRTSAGRMADQRWVLIKRRSSLPRAARGLHLELVLDDVHKTYEAPIQMKANGGLLVSMTSGASSLTPPTC
jgi:predicted ATPase with chaperone activity